MNSPICTAIAATATISFTYSGATRLAEPHCHGFTASGKEVVRAYQVEGLSLSGGTEGWRLFNVADIHDLQLLDIPFGEPRRGFNPLDPAMVEVHCHV